ncbi:primase-like DNA-binding domain-containing protein [Cryobacterium sp. 5B3]|uniref:primase-like DNA-binding domain-containing protein n=1 Tax=Cryobacterium sp. 5B3 TaxID=3048586 RepID=UPI002AB4D3BE|nr:primase-like DNA-binding domain-containing protein [Cryobacterium sp. 5B3]MDY7541778.1 primase-like DNA-binding domain-containing protein [Cryobacterium sp. 5B3]MEB0275242.1 primase-like DNA-binding domain-containing protein [Cryobacterium sp. 5B3]
MHTTERALGTAIAELNCLNSGAPASLGELTALSTAKACIEELLQARVAELRADARVAHSWASIAAALGARSPSSASQKYGNPARRNAPDDDANEHVIAFWAAFAPRFAWGFIPLGFVHALYVQWLSAEFPDGAHAPLSKETFTRRLTPGATASGEWEYSRSRPGSLMDAPEPLATRLGTRWVHDESRRAIYGLRRTTTLIRHASVADAAEHKELTR